MRPCLLVLALAAAGPTWADDAPASPAKPSWLTLSGSYRLRYESLDDTFRAGVSGPDRLALHRLLVAARAELGGFYVGLELEDARARLDRPETPLGTDDANAVELLQAFVGIRGRDVWLEDDSLDLTLGRMTLDVGSRRLVARNDFRNTLNAFTGASLVWRSSGGTRLQVFHLLPIDRRPTARAELADDEIDADEESARIRFFGAHVTQPAAWLGSDLELYVLANDEEDAADIDTRDRELVTSGFRLASPDDRLYSFEVEAALQLGESRSSTSLSDVRDLDHSAGFVHLQVARRFEGAWSPRLVLQYDYASGDEDPTDGDEGRFDTLFGARRSELGPTGIYGALARSNLSSPAVRLELSPGPESSLFLAYRAAWLAEDRDALTTAGVSDPSGDSGSFIGHQLEARVRRRLFDERVTLELGGAYLTDGELLREAPNAPPGGSTLYGYAQITLSW